MCTEGSNIAATLTVTTGHKESDAPDDTKAKAGKLSSMSEIGVLV